jgi:cytochrome P450
MLANVYSKSHIHSSEAAKAQARSILYRRLLPALDGSASPALEPNGIDVHSIFLATATDFISAYVFGLGGGTNFIQDKGYRQHWLDLYNSRNEHHFWPQEMPKMTAWFKALGIWLYPSWVDTANAELSDWNTKLCTATESRRSSERGEDNADEAVVWNVLASGIDKEAKVNGEASPLFSTVLQNRELSVASELFDHILAGQETTGTTLTYLTWHMSKRTALQHKLRQELLSLQPNMVWQPDNANSLPDAKQLDSLPLLHSIITETLRLHAPIPGSQARRTPFPGSKICGFEVPGGVRISGLAYTLHRDEAVFPDPLKWDHTRWLPSETADDERRERQRQFWAFSSGGRMCIGSNFAMHGKLAH